jgi:hypothetical protein
VTVRVNELGVCDRATYTLLFTVHYVVTQNKEVSQSSTSELL